MIFDFASADNAGAADALMNFDAQLPQGGSDDRRGAVLGECQLGVRVQVAPKFDQVRQQVGHLGQGGRS